MLRRCFLFALLATSCAWWPGPAHVAQARGANDLRCPVESVHAYRVVGGTYVAEGCAAWTEYACLNNRTPDVVCFRIAPVHVDR